MAKLAVGREVYYLRELATDHEQYLSGHGESPGRWYGAGAASLGVQGEASPAGFQRMFEGRHPDTGELLGRAHGKGAVPAFDVVLRPTKSVSVLYGLGDAATGWPCWLPITLAAPAMAGMARWLLVRRSRRDGELAFYACYGPAATPLIGLVRVAGSRWAVEEGFQQAKGEVGLDHYEVRKWPGWYRHITLALLAYTSLAVARAQAASGERAKGDAAA